MRQAWRGPIPPPHALEQFNSIVPGAAEKIINSFVDEGNHRRDVKGWKVDASIEDLRADRKEAKRGQYFGLTLGILQLQAVCFLR